MAPHQNDGSERQDGGPGTPPARPGMRIILVVGRFPSLSEVFILEQMQGLLDQGHDVQLFAWEPGETSIVHPLARRLQDEGRVTVCRRDGPIGALAHLLQALALRPVTVVRLLYLLLSGRRVARKKAIHALRSWPKGDVDIVHFQFGTEALALEPLVRIGFIRGAVVGHFRGSDVSRFVHEKGPQVYRPLWESLDLALANGRHLQRLVLALGCPPDKLYDHPSTTLSDPVPRRPTDAFHKPLRLLSVGRLVAKKGFDDGLRALARLVRRTDAHYTIVGAGAQEEELRVLAERLGVRDRVRFAGGMPHDAVLHAMTEADVFLAPNKTSDDGNTDGVPNTMKEAMAVGLPVVSSDHPGLAEVAAHERTALVYPVADAQGFADGMLRLARDGALRRRLVEGARAHVLAHYTVPSLTRRLEGHYLRLLRPEAAAPRRAPAAHQGIEG